ncbi:MAG: carbon-nitrogen hydrolase family protein, partial [Armatimonadota bacterium]
MNSDALRGWLIACVSLCAVSSVLAEDIFRERFDGGGDTPPLRHTWGDKPTAVRANAVEEGVGVNGSAAARLSATFPPETERKLSYWTYDLPDRVPLIPQLETISFHVKTNLPVSIKIGIAPFGFIYHGPGVKAAAEWQKITVADAYGELSRWCARGRRRAEDGWLSSVIVAVTNQPGAEAELIVDDIALEGPPGAAQALATEILDRRIRRVRVAAISLIWDEGHRTLEDTLAALDEAGKLGADLACLPQECVYQPAETIPGPAANAIAQKAAQYGMYVVGNLREMDTGRTYVTSFLCDREGKIAGRYRKSHRLPYENDIELGDGLPVFATDFGALGLKIGTDHYFPEIDTVLGRRGASLIVWSTKPFPHRDEHFIDLALRGRASGNRLSYVVARYAGKDGYGGYADRFSWTGSWPLGRAQVIARDGHTVADSGHAGGVALAAIPRPQLGGAPRAGGYDAEGMFSPITAPDLPPAPGRAGKRTIRAAAIECDTDMDSLTAKLDVCGKQGCDIACLW